MSGLDRAGYKQVSKNVHATVITSTMSGAVVTGDWCGFEVISSYADVALIQASGITGSSLITSADSLEKGMYIGGGKTTGIRLSAKSTGHKVIAYQRVVL